MPPDAPGARGQPAGRLPRPEGGERVPQVRGGAARAGEPVLVLRPADRSGRAQLSGDCPRPARPAAPGNARPARSAPPRCARRWPGRGRRAPRRGRAGNRGRRFPQHQVGVGAAETERADAGEGGIVGPPRPQRAGHLQRQRPGTGCADSAAEVQARRDLAVLERQRGLDQAGDAGGGLQVADVGLHRADQAGPRRRAARRRAPRPGACASIGSPSGVPVPCAST